MTQQRCIFGLAANLQDSGSSICWVTSLLCSDYCGFHHVWASSIPRQIPWSWARIQIEAYKKADSFIKGQLGADEQEQPKEELDYFGDPENAIQKSIENNPVLTEMRDALKEQTRQQKAQQIARSRSLFFNVHYA